jgi:hypothetical protein
VTADPVLQHTAYVVWTQFVTPDPSKFNDFSGPALLSLTRDGGRTWSNPRVIVPAAFRESTVGNVIVADPRSGRLYDLYERTASDAMGNPVSSDYDVVHSDDHGITWSAPTKVVDDTNLADTDPNTGAPVRTSAGQQAMGAVDPRTGKLFVVWEASNFGGGKYNEIGITSSKDGGRTWSAPRRVNRPTGRPAFDPAIAITRDGTGGVSYLDFRTLTPADTTSLLTSAWFTTVGHGDEEPGGDEHALLSRPFDMLQAPFSGGFFLGDYFGLAAQGETFYAVFAAVNDGNHANPTDILVARTTGRSREPSEAAIGRIGEATPKLLRAPQIRFWQTFPRPMR